MVRAETRSEIPVSTEMSEIAIFATGHRGLYNGLTTERFPVADRKGSSPPPILNGWKEIAKYMGMGVRTVQRYERQFGLPIRRPNGKARAAVIATTAELDAWVKARPLSRSFSLTSLSRHDLPASLDTFKNSLSEHQRLQAELSKMRQEVHDSVELLRSTLRFRQPETGTSSGLQLLDKRKVS
jgi:hypothetical protein